MAVFGRLLAATRPMLRAVINSGREGGNYNSVQRQSVRWSGDHHRHMNITPSRWMYQKTKDQWLLYILGPIIPGTIFIHLVNIYIGPSELAEIPEGYEPEYYEYFKHPITRWFCRHVYDNPQKNYEKAMHHIQEESDKVQMKLIEQKVSKLMMQRGDYQGWYYVPLDSSKYAERKIYERENSLEGHGRVD